MKKVLALLLSLSLMLSFSTSVFAYEENNFSSKYKSVKLSYDELEERVFEKYVYDSDNITKSKNVSIDSLSDEEIVEQGIEKVLILTEDGQVMNSFEGKDALNYLIEKERMQVEGFESNNKFFDYNYSSNINTDNIEMVQSYSTKRKTKDLTHNNKSIFDIKGAVFNMSSMYWPKTATVLYSIFGAVPSNEFEECSEIEFKNRQTRIFRKRTYSYERGAYSYPQLIVRKNETSHRLDLSLIFVNSIDHKTVDVGKDYGTLEVYENEEWDNIKDCTELAVLLYYGNRTDPAKVLFADMDNNLARITFDDYMNDVEDTREFIRWMRD